MVAHLPHPDSNAESSSHISQDVKKVFFWNLKGICAVTSTSDEEYTIRRGNSFEGIVFLFLQ